MTNKNHKILFFDTKPYDEEYFNLANKKYGFQLQYCKANLNHDTVFMAKGFDVVSAFVNDTIDKKVIERLVQDKVGLIALRSAGYNNVDLKSVYNKVHVVRVPQYSPYAVAEHAIALMLALNRKTHKAYLRTRDGNFSIDGLLGFDMHGKTVGVIGSGRIGKCLISILKGFGMKIIVYDRYPDKALAAEMGFEYASLNELYIKSDIISLHCPLTKDTYHLINDQSIDQMKPGVMIINTGRGKLIETTALIKSLKTGKIGSAGLDVYEEESEYFFEDFSLKVISDDLLARLLTFPNVLITSHQGFFTKEALTNIANTTLENVKDFFSGQYLKNEICYKCGADASQCKKKAKQRCF